MKKIHKVFFLLVVLTAISFSAKAQEIIFGIKTGINIADMNMKLDGVGFSADTDSRIGFNIGATVDYGFTENWFLQSGLDFTTKGTEWKLLGEKIKIKAYYLQIPIHAAYKFDVSEQAKLVISAGPYMACGVGGKTKVAGEKGDTFGSDGLDRFDFGLGLGAGLEVQNIAINLGYDHGLIDIGDEGLEVKNRNWYMSVGYKFKVK